MVSGISQAGALGYVLDDIGRLHAFNLDDGQPAWDSPVPLGNWRVHQTVAVAQGWVVIGPTDPGNLPVADKAVLALDAATGEERWRRNLAVRHISDPLIAGDLVVVALSDGHAAALNLADGALRWREPVAGTGLAAPTLAGELVIFGGDQGVLTARRIDDGSLAWTFTVEESGAWGNSFPYGAVFTGATVYATCWNRRCYALDAETGALRWESEPTIKRPALTAPVLGENALYFCGHDRYVYCLATDTGQRLWTRQFRRPAEIAPLLAGGALFVAAGDRCIYRLDPGSGELIGESVLETTGKVEAPWSCDGQRIFIADKAGFVYALAVAEERDADDPVELEAQGRWTEAAAVYALAGNMLRAGDIYRDHVGSAAKAAQLYERGGDLAQAAEQYAASGDLKTARRLYRDTGQLLLVARLSEQLDDLVGAAQAYEASGQWADAGRIYERLGAWPQAAGALEQAGDAARDAGDLPRAKAWWDRAAGAYQAAGQPEKAVQLYQDADQTAKAQAIVSSVADIALLRPLQRILLGPQRLARLLESEGQFVPAAEEHLRAEQPLEAARMYEAAGEYALASEHFQSQGYLLDAARTLALSGDYNAAAELYRDGGDFLRAAQAYAQASNHHQAAQTFEQINAWAEAAAQWAVVENWPRAAQAWCNAGNLAEAAAAWQQADDLAQAAGCFYNAAQQARSDETRREQAAAWYEQAMRLFREEGDWERAVECDQQRRFLRRQPLLEVAIAYLSEYIFDESGKLEVTVNNVGWGSAQNIAFDVAGQFEADLRQDTGRSTLAPDRNFRQSVYIIPQRVGRELPLTFSVSYTDRQGTVYRPLRRTFDISVRDKALPQGATPQQITVHGTVVMAEHIDELNQGDQVRINRPRAESGLVAKPDGLDVRAITCAVCQQPTPADQPKCSHCRAPFVRCLACGLHMASRAPFCLHCGQAM